MIDFELLELPKWIPAENGGVVMARIEIGKYLAVDTRICGGRLIIRGTRIMVADVLSLSERGYSPEQIADQYHGIITPDAINEALTWVSRGMIREVKIKARKAA